MGRRLGLAIALAALPPLRSRTITPLPFFTIPRPHMLHLALASSSMDLVASGEDGQSCREVLGWRLQLAARPSFVVTSVPPRS